jgi:hypothetical protein
MTTGKRDKRLHIYYYMSRYTSRGFSLLGDIKLRGILLECLLLKANYSSQRCESTCPWRGYLVSKKYRNNSDLPASLRSKSALEKSITQKHPTVNWNNQQRINNPLRSCKTPLIVHFRRGCT